MKKSDLKQKPDKSIPGTVEEYIQGFAPEVQAILIKIRQTIRKAVPKAEETISYRMPAFKLDGVVVWFAAFKNHIGMYPPVSGDPGLIKLVSAYAGEKGNLRFPLDQPIPYDLIERIVRQRAKQNQEKNAGKAKKEK